MFASVLLFWERLYWRSLAQPAGDRPMYASLLARRPRLVLVLGLQRGERAVILARLATKARCQERPPATDGNADNNASNGVRFVCVDPFEGRTEDDGPGLSLRKAHKILSTTDASVRCIPGPPEIGVPQVSRSERGIDWVLLSTPHYDWLATHGELLLATLAADAVVFMDDGERVAEKSRDDLARVIESRKKGQTLKRAG